MATFINRGALCKERGDSLKFCCWRISGVVCGKHLIVLSMKITQVSPDEYSVVFPFKMIHLKHFTSKAKRELELSS